ncbi:MAG: hypothetical protein QOH25_3946 [Acidobacteriota bacterium]|jgi:hypothetical protein|nr:hypothetical protein [Acidobacteriota bacterium]
MNLTELIADRPVFHSIAPGIFMEMGVNDQVLEFINEHIDETSTTLETGSGLSTVLFAIKASHHTAITPEHGEIDRIKEYCREHDVSMGRVTFKVATSEYTLPSLESPPFDLVLIDGRHGFPAPFIDWFYTAGKLKIGGFLIVDDIPLWTCGVLRDFLMQEPEWRLVADFSPRSVVFMKMGEGSEWKDWSQQKFVLEHGLLRLDKDGNVISVDAEGRLKRVLGHLRRGEFLILGRKVIRKIKG